MLYGIFYICEVIMVSVQPKLTCFLIFAYQLVWYLTSHFALVEIRERVIFVVKILKGNTRRVVPLFERNVMI